MPVLETSEEGGAYDSERFTMAHGAGGVVMQDFVKNHVLKILAPTDFDVPLEALEDAAVVRQVLFTTDSYTVKPLFFPGGDVGRLAVSGTTNDIAVKGGVPAAISLAFVVEEGFPMGDMDRILTSVRDTSDSIGIHVATGDTKVLERGAVDKIIVNTSGLGFRSPALDSNLATVRRFRPSFGSSWLLDSNVRPGDKVIISGSVGDHGAAIMSVREGYGLQSKIESDVAPVCGMIQRALEAGGVVDIKDPTRGGVANLLNEWSEKSHVGIDIAEQAVPMKPAVKSVLEVLGVDPLVVGNEGKVVFAVVPEMAELVLSAIRETKEGREAAVIGEATGEHDVVTLKSGVGGRRIVPPPAGDPVPRIC